MEEYLLNGTSTHHRYFFAGGSYEVQVDASATTTKEYYAIGGMMVAMNTKVVIGENETNTLTYMASDHLTSASIMLDDTGELLSEQRYMPFGEVRLDVGDTITETDLGYTGQRDYGDFGLSSKEPPSRTSEAKSLPLVLRQKGKDDRLYWQYRIMIK